MKTLFFSLFSPLVLCGAVYGAEHHIKTADELVTFSNNVNAGTTYSGYTVFLDSDIDLTGKAMNPIGTETKYFRGSFDGQGHIISNLKMSISSSSYVLSGLFGYTTGATIKNVVMDESCSITNSVNGGYVSMAGVLAYCMTDTGACTIENNVNMAKVTFKGSITGDLHIGGVSAVMWYTKYDIVVKNCVNYGTIIQAGTVKGYFDMGGIVGHCRNQIKSIKNCFNYGILRNADTTSPSKVFGGIVGYTCSDNSNYEEAHIENCLSAGIVECDPGSNVHIGGILGCINGFINTTITHCFWTEGEINCKACGDVNAIVTPVDSTIAELNSTIMEELFEYESGSSGGSGESEVTGKKHVLHLNGGRIGDFPEDTLTAIGKEFPVPVKDGNAFLFWCEDEKCKVRYDSKNESSNATDVYAMWKNNTVRFDVNGGNGLVESEMTVTYDSAYGDLPEPTREGYTFIGWFTEEDEEITNEVIVKIPMDHTLSAKWEVNKYNVTFVLANGTVIEKVLEYGEGVPYPEEVAMRRDGYTFDGWDVNDEFVPANDINITAQWTANNYTVTFDVNGGDALTEDEKNVTFDSAYGELPEPIRDGYTFTGWFTEEDEEVTSETVVDILNDITITAKWNPNEYTVTFDVNGGDALAEGEMRVTFDSAYGDSLPSPTRANYTFIGWFTEEDKEVTREGIVKISKDHTVTAQWKEVEYNVTFVFANGTVVEKPFKFNEAIEYPEEGDMRRDGYTFDGWDVNDEFAPAGGLNITAKWTANNYTVTFDVNGGGALTEDEKKVTFDSAYGELPEPRRDGYTFAGWFTEEDEEVTSETVVVIPKDHTLHAEWKQNPTSQVEIVFGSKDLSKDRVKVFIEKITDAEFKIVKFEKDDNKGETIVIIQFNDPKDAEEFIGKLSSSDDSMMTLVKNLRYASEESNGLSATSYPILSFLLLLMGF